MARNLILLAVGIAMGLGAGFVLFSPAGDPQAAPAAKPTAVAANLRDAVRDETAAAVAERSPAPEAPPAQPRAGAVGSSPAPANAGIGGEDETELLKRRVAELEGKLDLERKLRVESEGAELKKPENLPARFSEQAVRDALTAAFKELGVDAQVTSVDCTEYPCIAYGDGFGSREDSQRLEKTAAMGAYSGDVRNVYGWSGKGDDGKTVREFGVALYPKDDGKARGEELRKRLTYRVGQMHGAGK